MLTGAKANLIKSKELYILSKLYIYYLKNPENHNIYIKSSTWNMNKIIKFYLKKNQQ